MLHLLLALVACRHETVVGAHNNTQFEFKNALIHTCTHICNHAQISLKGHMPVAYTHCSSLDYMPSNSMRSYRQLRFCSCLDCSPRMPTATPHLPMTTACQFGRHEQSRRDSDRDVVTDTHVLYVELCACVCGGGCRDIGCCKGLLAEINQ
jgi:hypothetical protein